MVWDERELWQKAKVFADRASDADRESSAFPLWSILALELLARATLAHVHPALLADPQHRGDNLLYVFGFGATSTPKSITAKTVFARCKAIVPVFTERQEKQCLALIERRNAELHSGDLAFEQFPTTLWLADYFATCKILVEFQGRTLDELFGPEDARAANEMIDDVAATVRATVARKIADAKAAFGALGDAERAARLQREPTHAQTPNKVQTCPACGRQSIILGNVVRADAPRVDDDTLFRVIHVLPTMLACGVCGLMLGDHGELHAANLGGQYTATEVLDPIEQFALYEEPDYGND